MNAVEAVKTDTQREQVEQHLSEAGQIYIDVWKFGINTALRISDLLAIHMADVASLDLDNPTLKLCEIKTGKTRIIELNAGAMEVVQRRYAENPAHEWLFQSHRPRGGQRDPKPITRRSVARVFEAVGGKVRPRVQLSTHSMRKTRGYALHSAGMRIEAICKILNHSHPAVTMAYIGLDNEMVQKSYKDLVL